MKLERKVTSWLCYTSADQLIGKTPLLELKESKKSLDLRLGFSLNSVF